MRTSTPSRTTTTHAVTRTAARMGARIATIAAERGACTDQDLLAEGFTRSDLTRLGDAARAVAGRLAGTTAGDEPRAA